MAPLAPELRRDLERAVVRARDTAEEGARAAIAVLAVEASSAPTALSPSDRDLRTALRARGRSIGGGVLPLGIDGLVEEIAYEQWHRMLFARFLAENDLLLHPGGAAVSMTEVAALAAEEGERDQWVLAARYAAAMLPGIFRADDPAHQVRFAAEHRTRLEGILAALPAELFRADDALGWVYQFWQARRKKEVNESGRKIGGADLPPVTQLFTEHYMVRFLLENSLGAWWAGRHPKSPLLKEWQYLRFRDDGSPAAGTFDGWPERAAEITVMDPCMGSGHFLGAAADMLRKMRMEEEGLTAKAAAVAVVRDNLFGLELDPRCTQLGAFALAFDAWKAGGYQQLPVRNIACSGIAVKGQLEDWKRLAGNDINMAAALERLYNLFQDAPELGSLIDPNAAAGDGLWRVDPAELQSKLETALAKERKDPAAVVFGAAAEGTAKAARLLSGGYWLVATNPPFLGLERQGVAMQRYVTRAHPLAKRELAVCLFERFWEPQRGRCCAFVLPGEWTHIRGARFYRAEVLARLAFRFVAWLGPNSFTTPLRASPLLTIATSGDSGVVAVLNVSDLPLDGKGPGLAIQPLRLRLQEEWRAASDSRILDSRAELAGDRPITIISIADARNGLSAGDGARFERFVWELERRGASWELLQTSPDGIALFSGMDKIVLWEHEQGVMAALAASVRHLNHAAQNWRRGKPLWGRHGVVVSQIGALVGLYTGERFDSTCFAIVPNEEQCRPALAVFALSGELRTEIGRLAPTWKLGSPQTLLQVPFDLEHWTKVAAEQYPDGLPEPYSNDPTQWLFKGGIPGSTAPLQVAVARLLGYRWPDQEPNDLDELADDDGIVPLPPVRTETPAHERLRVLLARAYGPAWSPALQDRLLAEAGSPGASLESWLRDDFFPQHARLFGNRPFIWQVWDGRKDGFSVLLNYHRLDGPALEKLTYTYLNDWIERQKGRREEPAAEARLVAALELQGTLKQIVDGEPPFDIYVRWKSLAEQPIGWQPDLDDGVRLNIRPFVTAGILRAKFTIHWNKDRGANPDGSERKNDCHHSRAEKLGAREKLP
jgi:hypothetical protein